MKVDFEHTRHAHIEDRVKMEAEREKEPTSLNGRIAVALTAAVGTMWCAYAFAILAFIAFPDALSDTLKQGPLPLIDWLSQSFIQLVLLSVIMVGQNAMNKKAEDRAELTFKDAEAAFHESQQIQLHLQKQDEAINHMVDRLAAMEQALKGSDGKPQDQGTSAPSPQGGSS